jgi:hypothetical protein
MRVAIHAACFVLAASVLTYAVLGASIGLARFTTWPDQWWPVKAEFGYWLNGVLSWVLVGTITSSLVVLLGIMDSKMRRPEATSPLDQAGMLSRVTFWWVMPTLRTAHAKGKLDLEDLPEIPAADEPGSLHRKFAANCSKQKLKEGAWWGLITNALFHNQRAVFLQSFFLGWLFLALMFLDPIILNALLSSVASSSSAHLPASPSPSPPAEEGEAIPAISAEVWYRFALVFALSASMLVRVSCMEMCYFTSVRACNNARSTLVLAIFSFTLDSSHSANDTGRLTNLMATDADKFGACS